MGERSRGAVAANTTRGTDAHRRRPRRLASTTTTRTIKVVQPKSRRNGAESTRRRENADRDARNADATPRNVANNLRAGVLAGSCAAMACQLVLFPVNTIKTRTQARAIGAPGRLGARDFTQLYRGIVPDLIGAIPGTALFMGTYETLKKSFGANPGVAAACGALAASVVLAPMELLSRRMQANRMTLWTAVRIAARKREFGVGMASFLARELPFDMIQMSAFEMMKSTARRAKGGVGEAELAASETAVIGGAAGALTGLLTTPFDVSRTADVCAGSLGLNPKTHPGGLRGLRKLAESFGVRFFFRGAVPRMIEISLGGMIYFTVIERVRSFMDAREEEAKRMKSLKRGSPKTRGGGGARRTETPPKLV
jgi:solute carrier family 25 S-adenosylmethionine transporter 26